MTLPSSISKWGTAVLGVVSTLLAINLVTQYRGMQPGNSHVHAAPQTMYAPRAEKGSSHATSSHAADDLSRYDPTVHFNVLKAQDSRPLPDEDRNPFEFAGVAPPSAPVPLPLPKPAPPPPPPPPPLKAMGYNELPGGKKEAMMQYNDDVDVVHEGDVIGTRYKVVTINPTMVVVEDGQEHRTIELPFPP
jgi:hypothetical protein